MRNQKRGQGGFSMIELMLVGGGVSAVIAAAFLAAPSVRQHAAVSNADALTVRIVNGVEARFAMFANFAGIDTISPAYVEGVALDGGALRSPWGAVSLAPETSKRPADGWSMTLDGIPRDACAEFVARVSGRFAGTVINDEPTGAANGQTVAPEIATDLCAHTSNRVKLIARTMMTSAAPVMPAWATTAPSSLPAWTPSGAATTSPAPASLPAYMPTPTPIPYGPTATPTPTPTPTPAPGPAPTATPTPAPTPAPTSTPTPTPSACPAVPAMYCQGFPIGYGGSLYRWGYNSQSAAPACALTKQQVGSARYSASEPEGCPAPFGEMTGGAAIPEPAPVPTPAPAPACTTTYQYNPPTIAGVHACHRKATTCCAGVCTTTDEYGATEEGNGICHWGEST